MADPEEKRPNIVVIWGDDIGVWNLSAYNRGAMGYRTPNIDRIANEGAIFSDHCGQPSCTPGRAAFITSQLPIRTGLTSVGFVGGKQGLQEEDPTLATVLKSVGYRCGQFGKNHLGVATSTCPPFTASTSSSGTCTTSTPRRSERASTTRPTRRSRSTSGPAGCCTRGRPTSTTRPSTRASARSAGSASPTPGN